MKKLLLLMLGALIALPTLARDFRYTYEGQTLTYTVIDEDAKTVMTKPGSDRNPGNKVSGDLILPSEVYDGATQYTLTEIGENAFYDCDELTSVIIPNSVTTIGDYAFCGVYNDDVCDNLASITIGNSVTTIGEGAFYGRNGLNSVTIPNSVTYIGDLAFSGCSGLTSVFVGESLSYFDTYLFMGCTSLKAINVAAGNSNYTSVDGIVYSKDMSQLIQYPAGKEETEFTIPNSVTEIGACAFRGCSGLTSVTIGNSVIEIGSWAFEGCTGLTSVTIPNSVTRFENHAFYGCSNLTSVTIHNSVTHIGDYAFSGCSGLTSVTYFTEKPITGAANIFDNETYRKATLNYLNSAEGKIALTMPWRKFDYCVGFDSAFTYTYAGQTLTYMILDEEAKTCQVAKNDHVEGNVEIPEIAKDASNNYTVTAIDSRAFEGCSNLTSATIPNSVTTIGYRAFYDCSGLTSVSIGTSVTEIGDYAFLDCTGLTDIIFNAENCITCGDPFPSSIRTITIGESVKTIPSRAFENCTGLTSVTIPNSVTTIGDEAFYGCSGLTSVTIGNSVTEIGDWAFEGCTGLTSVSIGESVSIIDNNAFYGCTNLKAINVAEGNSNYTSFDGVLYSKNMSRLIQYPAGKEETKFTIPVSVTEIGGSAFSWCTGLTSIVIPISVIYIGNYAFENCTGMTSVTIPNSVWYLFSGAFSGCSGLTSVTYFAEYPVAAWANIFDEETYQNATLNYLNSAEGVIATTEPWSLFINRTGHDTDFTYTYAGQTLTYTIISEDEKTVQTKAGTSWDNAGNNVSGDLEIPTVVTYNGKQYSVIAIGNYAFRDCSGLTSVTIPDSVTVIGRETFKNCSGLESVTIPNSVTEIGNYAFEGCSGLTSVTIPNSVTEIGNYAFEGCSGLLSIYIGESVSSLGDGAFSRCTSLKAINVAEGNSNYTSIDGVLYPKDMSRLIQYPAGKDEKEFTIPNSVTEIGISAFYGCSGLTSVTIPNSVIRIDNNAFVYCTGLTSVDIPNSVTCIDWDAFLYCSGLTSVTIPNSVTTIEEDAFYGCTGLTSVTYLAENPIECKYIFEDKIYQNATLNYLKSAETLIDTTEPWSLFINRIGRDADYKEEVAISEVQATDGGVTVVYDMLGVKVGESTEGLPKGIYIVREGATTRKIAI